MASSDLRKESGITDRATFTRAIDELQAAMIVVPSEAVYLPKFTYLWTLGIGRFPDALLKRGNRDTALREIARCFLSGAGDDDPWRARACDGAVPARSRARQSRAGRGGLCHFSGNGLLQLAVPPTQQLHSA